MFHLKIVNPINVIFLCEEFFSKTTTKSSENTAFLSKLHAQHGAQSHHPDIESHALLTEQPGSQQNSFNVWLIRR